MKVCSYFHAWIIMIVTASKKSVKSRSLIAQSNPQRPFSFALLFDSYYWYLIRSSLSLTNQRSALRSKVRDCTISSALWPRSLCRCDTPHTPQYTFITVLCWNLDMQDIRVLQKLGYLFELLMYKLKWKEITAEVLLRNCLQWFMAYGLDYFHCRPRTRRKSKGPKQLREKRTVCPWLVMGLKCSPVVPEPRTLIALFLIILGLFSDGGLYTWFRKILI